MRRICPSLTWPLGSGPIRTVRFGTRGTVGFGGVSTTLAARRGELLKKRHCGCAAWCRCMRASMGDLRVRSTCGCEAHSRRASAAHDGRKRDIERHALVRSGRSCWLLKRRHPPKWAMHDSQRLGFGVTSADGRIPQVHYLGGAHRPQTFTPRQLRRRHHHLVPTFISRRSLHNHEPSAQDSDEDHPR
jgi:hypothetical protein